MSKPLHDAIMKVVQMTADGNTEEEMNAVLSPFGMKCNLYGDGHGEFLISLSADSNTGEDEEVYASQDAGRIMTSAQEHDHEEDGIFQDIFQDMIMRQADEMVRAIFKDDEINPELAEAYNESIADPSPSDEVIAAINKAILAYGTPAPSASPDKDEDASVFGSTADERTSNNTMRNQYRTLSQDEKDCIDDIKLMGEDFFMYLDALESTREISIAKTKIEEAVMWAVRSITA